MELDLLNCWKRSAAHFEEPQNFCNESSTHPMSLSPAAYHARPAPQNPSLVRVKEGITRSTTRIKSGEKELAKLRTAHQEQLQKLAKMEDQLQALQDGEWGPGATEREVDWGQQCSETAGQKTVSVWDQRIGSEVVSGHS